MTRLHKTHRRLKISPTALAFMIGLLALAGARGSQAVTADWDSIPEIETFVMDTTFVDADDITIREIIQRAVSGEQSKLSGHNTLTFTSTIRTIVSWDKKKIVSDEVYRSYNDTDGNARHVALDKTTRHYKKSGSAWATDEEKDEDDDDSPVRVETSRASAFSRLPFFLEDDHEFDFELIDRTLDGDHVIFKIGFHPKSDFKPLPSGVIYIETPEYRIVHEVYNFNRNPAPLFLKNFKRISRHWNRLDTGEWVFTKVFGEIDLRADPFGFIPKTVSIALDRDDFKFDQPYDAHLFGEFDAPRFENTNDQIGRGDADDNQPGRLLSKLQSDDFSFFSPELQETNRTFRNAVLSQHDTLGLDGYKNVIGARRSRFNYDLNIADKLIDYNRVEGLLIGVGTEFSARIPFRLNFDIEGAYANRAEKVRYFGGVDVPLRMGKWDLDLAAAYSDRVVPFGSNRPTLNALRAILGGADRQDYLRRTGGSGTVTFTRGRAFSFTLGYGAARERNTATASDFAFVGNMSGINPPIDEGIDRNVRAGFTWNPDLRFKFGATQRVSGGDLSGDFRYNRTDLHLETRRYLLGRHELSAKVTGIVTGDAPPIQQLADIGGLSTIRGFDRRSLLGKKSLATRFEYLIPYDIFRRSHIPILQSAGLQLVPWFDAGRVWDGNSDRWVHSAGAGVQFYFAPIDNAANLRIDFAFPTSDTPRPDARVLVHFTGLF